MTWTCLLLLNHHRNLLDYIDKKITVNYIYTKINLTVFKFDGLSLIFCRLD